METNTTQPFITTEAAADLAEDYVGDHISDQARAIFIVFGIVLIFARVVGNILIIVTICITKTMRNPHYYFIVNLAVADILITGYVLPHFVVSLIIRRYPVVDFNHCVFNGMTTVVAFVSSLLSLMVISVNRYLSVCHNQRFSRIFSNKIVSSVAGCAIIWFLAVLSTLPCLFGWGRFVFDRKKHYCGYDRTYSFSYTLFLLIFSIGTPVMVVFVCNFAIWCYVRQSSHRIYAFKRDFHGKWNTTPKPGPSSSTSTSSNMEIDYSTERATYGSYLLPPNVQYSKNCHTGVNIFAGETRREEKTDGHSQYSKKCQDIEIHGGKTGRGEEIKAKIDVAHKNDNGAFHIGVPCINGAVPNAYLDSEESTIQKEENQTQTPISIVTNNLGDMMYPMPWDGTSNLIGLEIREMRSDYPKPPLRKRKPNSDIKRCICLERGQREVMTSRPTVTLTKLIPVESSGVLVTPDELALIKTVFAIFIIFAVLMMPYMISTLLDRTDQWSPISHMICSMAPFANSCVNCVLYGLMTPAFKRAYKKILPCFQSELNTVTIEGRGDNTAVLDRNIVDVSRNTVISLVTGNPTESVV